MAEILTVKGISFANMITWLMILINTATFYFPNLDTSSLPYEGVAIYFYAQASILCAVNIYYVILNIVAHLSV